jgi:putative peptidoglycan lipid II flippase
VKTGLITLLLTQLMNVAFIWILPLGHAGLALSISLGACINAVLLFYHLRHKRIFDPQPGWGIFIAKLFIAVASMALVLWFAMGSEAQWLNGSVMTRVSTLAMLVVLGAGVYLGSLRLMGFRLKDFAKRAL